MSDDDRVTSHVTSHGDLVVARVAVATFGADPDNPDDWTTVGHTRERPLLTPDDEPEDLTAHMGKTLTTSWPTHRLEANVAFTPHLIGHVGLDPSVDALRPVAIAFTQLVPFPPPPTKRRRLTGKKYRQARRAYRRRRRAWVRDGCIPHQHMTFLPRVQLDHVGAGAMRGTVLPGEDGVWLREERAQDYELRA